MHVWLLPTDTDTGIIILKNNPFKMRYIFLSLFIVVTPCKSQELLGQTKRYVINQYSECYLSPNSDGSLVVNCGGDEGLKYFSFDKNGLCNYYSIQKNRDKITDHLIMMAIYYGLLPIKGKENSFYNIQTNLCMVIKDDEANISSTVLYFYLE